MPPFGEIEGARLSVSDLPVKVLHKQNGVLDHEELHSIVEVPLQHFETIVNVVLIRLVVVLGLESTHVELDGLPIFHLLMQIFLLVQSESLDIAVALARQLQLTARDRAIGGRRGRRHGLQDLCNRISKTEGNTYRLDSSFLAVCPDLSPPLRHWLVLLLRSPSRSWWSS